MKAYVLIKTKGSGTKSILKKIRGMKTVKEASGVYGPYDIVALMEGNDLADIVIDDIRKIDGVSDTLTLIVAL